MHRALGSCTVWHLALKDIQTLAHVYPEMLLAMVEAFKGRWEHHLDAMGPDKRHAVFLLQQSTFYSWTAACCLKQAACFVMPFLALPFHALHPCVNAWTAAPYVCMIDQA